MAVTKIVRKLNSFLIDPVRTIWFLTVIVGSHDTRRDPLPADMLLPRPFTTRPRA